MIKGGRFTLASWSTFGQTALLIFAALLMAQTFAFFLLRGFWDKWQSSYVVQPAITRFADVAQKILTAPADRRDQILLATTLRDEQFWIARDLSFVPFGRRGEIEKDLEAALKKRSVPFSAVVTFRRGGFGRGRPIFLDDRRPPLNMQPRPDMGASGLARPEPGRPPLNIQLRPDMGAAGLARPEPGRPLDAEGPNPGMPFRGGPLPNLNGGPPLGQPGEEIRMAALLADGNWLVGRFIVRKSVPLFLNPMMVSQLALFVILLTGSLFWASRISRPLQILARAAEVLRPQDKFEPIPVKGPRDVQVAINSFNTMAQRVRELLQEKDRMLSAIGHDLRTPLASLRIRAESIEPEAERERFIESVDEMTHMVEEILGLARLGQSTEPRQLVDLSALADSLVEEYHGLGLDVTCEESPRTPLAMQVGLVRRLIRNLIDNAVKYGERAQVAVRDTGEAVELSVEDEGPGIPPERLSEVVQPFTRLEHSRSRQTGGIGLGLSIADAIARSQGAELVLENRPGGGLRAVVRWLKPVENAS